MPRVNMLEEIKKFFTLHDFKFAWCLYIWGSGNNDLKLFFVIVFTYLFTTLTLYSHIIIQV